MRSSSVEGVDVADGAVGKDVMLLEPQLSLRRPGQRERHALAEKDGKLEELEPVDRAEIEEGVSVERPPSRKVSLERPAARKRSSRPCGVWSATTTSAGTSAGTGREVNTKICFPGHGRTDGKGVEGYAHLDPRPVLEAQVAARQPGATPTGWPTAMTARLEARGHTELEARATSAYEEAIASGEFRSRRREAAERRADVVKFRWEMVSTKGEVAGVGLEFLALASDGRIRCEYEFVES